MVFQQGINIFGKVVIRIDREFDEIFFKLCLPIQKFTTQGKITDIPRKIKTAALRESMNAKLMAKDLFCIDRFDNNFSKTKEFAKFLTGLNLQGKILALLEERDEKFERVSRNIPSFRSILVKDVNAYDILRSKKILLTKGAFKKLLERIQ